MNWKKFTACFKVHSVNSAPPYYKIHYDYFKCKRPCNHVNRQAATHYTSLCLLAPSQFSHLQAGAERLSAKLSISTRKSVVDINGRVRQESWRSERLSWHEPLGVVRKGLILRRVNFAPKTAPKTENNA